MSKNVDRMIGYGSIHTSIDPQKVDKTSTKSYKSLQKMMLEDIYVEIFDKDGKSDNTLYNLINNAFEKKTEGNQKRTALVIPNLNVLGTTQSEVLNHLSFILMVFDLHVIGRPELSTCDEYGAIKTTDINEILSKVNEEKINNRGRKTLVADIRFQSVFWAWQNYFINTDSAIQLLACTKMSLYSTANQFIFNSQGTIYYDELKTLLFNAETKPIRGLKISKELKNAFIFLSRERARGDISNYEFLSRFRIELQREYHGYNNIDTLRILKNLSDGRSAMASATKANNKGTNYVEKIALNLKTFENEKINKEKSGQVLIKSNEDRIDYIKEILELKNK